MHKLDRQTPLAKVRADIKQAGEKVGMYKNVVWLNQRKIKDKIQKAKCTLFFSMCIWNALGPWKV